MLKTQFAKEFCLCSSFFFVTATFAAIQKNKPHVHDFDSTRKSVLIFSHVTKAHFNGKGIQFVKNYIKKSDRCLEGVKNRSKIPFNIIDSVFRQYGLPVELKYLAVIESELKPTALSCVGARGPWQLMPGTAHDLGLKINKKNDERTDYYKSTKAAALYLKDLYAQFSDWLLVLAAYNGGPKPVYTAIHKSGSRNFWALQNYLPAESREHVKKFIATHYYFDGGGSEMTLTKAEDMEYAKDPNELVISCSVAEIPMPRRMRSVNANTIRKRKDLSVHYEMKPKVVVVPENDGKDNSPQKNQKLVGQFESSEHKFKRLMKESEEALKRSTRLIQG